ncbi:MAG: DUF1631 domain-containing protein, partial [Kangiellaceae bacterium]|nr:DUF1631 domain-containing protein [Kangiellaceae bacterium]
MGNSRNIVDFSHENVDSKDSKSDIKLSTSIEDVLELFLNELELRLNKLYADVDDHLFDKSGKSDDSSHFAALRELRVKKNESIAVFKDEVSNGFANSLAKEVGNETYIVEEVSYEQLALVEENDLEERIAIDTMVNRADKANKVALANIAKRLDALCPNKTITDDNNPFVPEGVCSAFNLSLSKMELSTEFKLVLYKFFDRTLIHFLDVIYEKVNAYFIDNGILPDLKNIPVSPVKKQSYHYDEFKQDPIDSVSPTPVSQPSEQGSTLPHAESAHLRDGTLTQPAQDSSSGSEPSIRASADNKEIVGLLHELLAFRRGAQTEAVPQAVETPHLIGLLSNIQQSESAAQSNQVLDIRSQISTLLPSEISSQLASGALGQANDDMIDVVTMLFDFILDDENLHAEIKAVIARLQIPILKVGLADKSFFSNRKHSARLLLNELAHAGLSWEPDDVNSEPMLTKIKQIVEQICNEFSDDVSMFDKLLDDFSGFKNDFRKRAQIFEKRTREAEEGKARAESARSKVNSEIRRICQRKLVPDVAKQLLKTAWVHVMFLESLKEDDEGWEKVSKLAQMLIWSLQPVKEQTRLDKLKKMVPVLIKNLKLGFDKISLSQIEASALLDRLEDEHRKIITDAKVYIEENSKDEIIRLKPADPFEKVEQQPEVEDEPV